MSHPEYENIGSPSIKLVEEASELIKELSDLVKHICKAERFGYESDNNGKLPYTNIDQIFAEMHDVEKAINKFRIPLYELKKQNDARLHRLSVEEGNRRRVSKSESTQHPNNNNDKTA